LFLCGITTSIITYIQQLLIYILFTGMVDGDPSGQLRLLRLVVLHRWKDSLNFRYYRQVYFSYNKINTNFKDFRLYDNNNLFIFCLFVQIECCRMKFLINNVIVRLRFIIMKMGMCNLFHTKMSIRLSMYQYVF